MAEKTVDTIEKAAADQDAAKDYKGGPFMDLTVAPLPTPQTLRSRKAIVPQLFKFVGFDLTIMRMVLKGHAHD